MREEEVLLTEFYNFYKYKILNNVIESLKVMSDNHLLLYNEKYPLINVWEEICVQIQGYETDYWDEYESKIESEIYYEFDQLPSEIRKLLEYILFEYDLEQGIYDLVIQKANVFKNKRITEYLDKEDDSDFEEDKIEDFDEDFNEDDDLFDDI